MHLLSLLASYLLPSLAARLSLFAIYRIRPSLRPKSSSQSHSHARLSYALVILIYFVYSLVSAYTDLANNPNYFVLLGLPVADVEDSTLKSQWRQLARLYHPDKVGLSDASQRRFVAMRTAFETLADENKRDAYMRFGPDIISACAASRCINTKDYMTRGIHLALGFYLSFSLTLILLSLFRRAQPGSFWRYIALFALFSLESSLILSPKPLNFSFLHLTTYEQVSLLRSFFIALSSVITQLGPLLSFQQYHTDLNSSPSSSLLSSASSSSSLSEQSSPLLDSLATQLAQISIALENESVKLMCNDFQPLVSASTTTTTTAAAAAASPSSSTSPPSSPTTTTSNILSTLKSKMLHTFIDLRLKATPQGSKAWEEAVRAARRSRKEKGEKESKQKKDKKNQKSVEQEKDYHRVVAATATTTTTPPPLPTLKRRDSRIMQTPSPSPSPRNSRHASPSFS